jgi:endonuclease/exonuclease/phosphatase family metal-dependent hydrolase
MTISALTALMSLLAAAPVAAADGPAVVLDGLFNDWTAPPALVDPVDASANAPIDIREVYHAHDADYVYLRINLSETVNLQHLDGCLSIAIDGDGDPETGREAFGVPGAEIAVQFTPPNTKRNRFSGVGVGVLSTNHMPREDDPNARTLTGYDAGVTFAPTYASREFEMRIARGVQLPEAAPLFMGDHATLRLSFSRANGQPIDETASFRIDLTNNSPVVIAQPTDPLTAPADTIRVMSWNGERGALFEKKEIFARVFRALQPDVVLLQEMTNKHSARMIEAFFNDAVSPGDGREWTVAFGAGGGNLRTAVVSRYPMEVVSVLDEVRYRSNPKYTMRLTGGIVTKGDDRILFASTHLKCCGRINSKEDTKRMEEAGLINEVLAEVARRNVIHGMVIGGDLNLVGSVTPRAMIAEGRDVDGTPLGVVEAMQLDGRDNATWSDRGQPFVPGRLDYLLYTDAVLAVRKAFVLDTQDLDGPWREAHRLELLDTELASDHMPVVADLEVLPRTSRD